jgi:hypothetical protein
MKMARDIPWFGFLIGMVSIFCAYYLVVLIKMNLSPGFSQVKVFHWSLFLIPFFIFILLEVLSFCEGSKSKFLLCWILVLDLVLDLDLVWVLVLVLVLEIGFVFGFGFGFGFGFDFGFGFHNCMKSN